MTWAGDRSEQPRSLQSPVMFFLLTLPFIERACVYEYRLNSRVGGNLEAIVPYHLDQ